MVEAGKHVPGNAVGTDATANTSGNTPAPQEISEAYRRTVWSSAMDRIASPKFQRGAAHVPYFAVYGEGDERAILLRAIISPKQGRRYKRLVAITVDGPFTLDLDPQIANADFFANKLARDAIMLTNKGGYMATGTADNVERSITLDEGRFKFTGYSGNKKDNQIEAADALDIALAITYAEPERNQEGREELANVLRDAAQKTGIENAECIMI